MVSMQFFCRPSSLVCGCHARHLDRGGRLGRPRSRRAAPMPHLAAGDVNAAWQFPAKNWSSSNKEAGRVDDILRIGKPRVHRRQLHDHVENHSGKTVTRTYLAAENANTGALLNWNPTLNGRVYAMGASQEPQVALRGGEFTKVNGVARTHWPRSTWPRASSARAIPALGINGPCARSHGPAQHLHRRLISPRPRAAPRAAGRLNLSAATSGRAWNPTADNDVRDLIADGAHNRVIVAGWFNRIDGVQGQMTWPRSRPSPAARCRGGPRARPGARHRPLRQPPVCRDGRPRRLGAGIQHRDRQARLVLHGRRQHPGRHHDQRLAGVRDARRLRLDA